MAARPPRWTQTADRQGPGPEEPPEPIELAKLRVFALHKRREVGRAKRENQGWAKVALATAVWLVAKVNTFLPVRAFLLYTRRRGPLMAAGISYNMFFAVAAMLVAGFSILGLVVSGNTELQQIIIEGIDRQVPNLIGTGQDGLIAPEQLFSVGGGLSITLVISTGVMLFVALRYIGSLRQGMRGIFDLPPVQANPVLAKIKDLGILGILAVAMVITLAAGVVANTLLDVVVDFFRLGAVAGATTRVVSFAVMLILDMTVAVILFRLASRIEMPRMAMFQAALIAGVGGTLLRTFSTLALGAADRNPLLAPFAVILGLFIWFFLLNQVFLFATAWGAIRTADAAAKPAHGVDAKRPSLRRRARAAQH